MKNMTSLTHLKEKAFAISSPIKVIYPYDFEDFFDPTTGNYTENTYRAHNHEIIAFFTENVLYVIPFTYKAIKILENAQFTFVVEDNDMYIPFCEHDYPVTEYKKWLALKSEASALRSEEFTYECIEYCDSVNIGSIDDSLLEKCFKIPEEGLIVQFPDSMGNLKPVSHQNWGLFLRQLGHYNTNKDTYVFVYRDGKTYVTRCYDVVLALKKAGYQPNFNMYVPLSNGEKIIDTKYDIQWKKVKVM